MSEAVSVVMLGATGAVGGHVAHTLAGRPDVSRLSLLGRRPLAGIAGETLVQHTIDALDPATYETLLPGHDVAICTFGVGQPSKISKDEFLKIDHDAVLAFAAGCKAAGVRHFELLSSVAVDPASKSFYLQTKGKLEASLEALGFARLSFFHPSAILTPSNRYGLSQAVTLVVMRFISPVMFGPMRKFRGVEVRTLGRAIALNVFEAGQGVQTLQWDDFQRLSGTDNE